VARRLAVAVLLMAGIAAAPGCGGGARFVGLAASAPKRSPASARQRAATPTAKAKAEEVLAGSRAQVKVGEIVVGDPTGKRLWRASAKVIDYDYDKAQAVLRDVQCVFAQDNEPALEGRAPLATAFLEQHRVVLTGGVVARAPTTGASFRADRVEWNTKNKEVSASGGVKYVQRGLVISGDRLLADLELKRARLEGHVHMEAVQLPGGAPTSRGATAPAKPRRR
jgi:LPS export ABC transporter protein LptC